MDSVEEEAERFRKPVGTTTVTITTALAVCGQPPQHGEVQKAFTTYRLQKEYKKLKMREYRKRPKS